MEILISILVIAIILAFLYFATFLPSQAKFRGMLGEHTVAYYLNKLPEDYYLWNDIVLQQNGYSVQIDHVVISIYGIFVIETKNYTGNIIGNDDCDQWTKNVYGYKYHFGNPIKQNHSHVNALRKLFSMPEHFFIPIVVFLPGANLHCNTRGIILYASQLLDEIYKHKTQVITLDDVKRLSTILNAETIETKDTRKEHLNKVYERINKKNDLISKGICPNCGGHLVERRGRYGVFLGCSNYPKCKFCKPI